MTVITSRQHPIVRQFRDLARGGGTGMLLDGWHLLMEAVQAGVTVDTVAVCGPPPEECRATIDVLRRAGARIVDVSTTVLDAISPVNAPSGVVAAAERPRVDLASVLTPAPALVLAAIGIQDPGNTGALVRSAAAAGGTGVVVDAATADPWGWKALRSSMGSAFRVPVVRTPAMAAAIDAWRAAGVTVVAAVPRDGVTMYDLDLARATAIVLGGEGAGLPADVIAQADARVTVPMGRAIESLNVSVAAAVLLYEAMRQRRA